MDDTVVEGERNVFFGVSLRGPCEVYISTTVARYL